MQILKQTNKNHAQYYHYAEFFVEKSNCPAVSKPMVSQVKHRGGKYIYGSSEVVVAVVMGCLHF